jgi:anti-sigma28 factor (negative regulator of flagellin synthesis)
MSGNQKSYKDDLRSWLLEKKSEEENVEMEKDKSEKKYNEEQLNIGRGIEKEHLPTVEKIKASIKDGKITMSNEDIYESIAKDHLDELPRTYYTLLQELEVTGKKMESEMGKE